MLLSDLYQQKFSWGRGHLSSKPPPSRRLRRLATPPATAASPSATIILILPSPPQPKPETTSLAFRLSGPLFLTWYLDLQHFPVLPLASYATVCSYSRPLGPLKVCLQLYLYSRALICSQLYLYIRSHTVC